MTDRQTARETDGRTGDGKGRAVAYMLSRAKKHELDVVSEVQKTGRHGDQDNTILSVLLVAYRCACHITMYVAACWILRNVLYYACSITPVLFAYNAYIASLLMLGVGFYCSLHQRHIISYAAGHSLNNRTPTIKYRVLFNDLPCLYNFLL